MKVRISNIQRFCLKDGPGIRTTVFLKGCNLRCPWCSNPENIDYEFTEYINPNTNEHGVFGKDIEIMDLYNEIIKDKEFFKLNNGGVTFSGGEPLLQIKELKPLLVKLNKEKINIAFETALHVPIEFVKIASEYIDNFIIDIKILDSNKCKKVLNGNLEQYYKNLEFLSELNKIIIFRIPIIKEYTLNEKNMDLIYSLLKKYNCEKVEIFKIHNLAESKYKSINKKLNRFEDINDEDIERVYQKIKNIGAKVEIIKI